MLISWVVLIVCVLGLLLWALATNPLAKEAGRIAYGCALLALCFAMAGKVVRLL